MSTPVLTVFSRRSCRCVCKDDFFTLFATEQRSPKRRSPVSRLKETVGMTPSNIDPDMSVDEIMRRWPETIRVMIRHGMLCVGCPIGTFHTVVDAALAHAVDEASFLAELLAAIRPDSSTESPPAIAARDPEPCKHEGEASCA
jgi:hybrid cluster-associated redox disulfide protein